ncbi:MAG: hypothetical protein Q8M16_21070 [Pirellulaceae bacterium]|nr:hypothetical protein [Pirellulaceae bacterium]
MGFLLGLFLRFVSWIADSAASIGRIFEYWFFRGLEVAGQIFAIDRWIGHALFQMSSPFRWFFSLFSGTQESENFIARCVAWVLWPFHYVVDRLDRLGSPREGSFSDRSFRDDEQLVKKRLDKDIQKNVVAQKLAQSWVSRFGRIVQAPFVGVADFFWQLLTTRRAGLWFWSMPLILIVGLLAGIFFTQNGQDPRFVARYEAALSDAIKVGDPEKIKLYRLKLAQLGSSTVRGEYQLALAMFERGEVAEAYELMKKLAPEDQIGFEGAHYWIAVSLIEGKLDEPAPKSLHLALKHLELLKVRMGEESEIQLLEGLAYARLGRIPAAINALTPIANSNLVASFLLMEIYNAEGQHNQAREQAISVQRKLTQAIDQGQELTDDQRRWQTAATKIIGDAKLAAESVEQWYRANPTSVEARVNRTRLLLQQVNDWFRSPDAATLSTTKEKLIQATASVPMEQAGMLSAVSSILYQQKKQNPVIETLYQELLADPQLSGIIVEAFGTMAAVDQDWNTAEALFQRSTTANPDWGNAWNNWAYVISASFPDRLDEALRHVDRAIQIDPDNPDYHETRGMINYKLRNYEAAISDLEIAANGVNQLESVHAALADSHRRLGNPKAAEIYEQQTSRRRN